MEKKYIIYKNDLKYRENRNIDINKVDLEQNNIKHLININHDTLEYRISESKEVNYKDLDLEMLKLNEIPSILRNNIFTNLKFLFIANNNLSNTIDLTFLKNLEILDVTHNNITNIILPHSLIELCACNNSITKFISNENLKRLKISNNKINEMNLSKTLELLEVNNNNILSYDFTNFNKLNKLIIYSNPLKKILLPQNTIYIDLSETLIDNIQNLYKVEHLVLNNCKEIKILPLSDNIKNLELIGTPIEKLYFYKNYEFIMTQLNLTKNISSKYKNSNANIQVKKNTFLVISRNINIFEE
jgi:hypothetical protein